MSNHPVFRRETLRLLVLTSVTLTLGLLALAAPLAAEAHVNSRFVASAARLVPRSLRLAATTDAQADRALVADAKTLRACQSSIRTGARLRRARCSSPAPGRPRPSASSARAALSTATASVASRAGTQRSPGLSVAGELLRWTRVGRVSSYVLEERVPGQAPQYAGTSTWLLM